MESGATETQSFQFDLTEGRFSAREASLYAKRNDPADFALKILELIDDPQKRAAMGRFGRHRVENELEWRYEAPKLLAAYDAVWGIRPQGASSGGGPAKPVPQKETGV